VISGSHACRDCVWRILLVAELYTTCPGERVLVATRFNVTFLLWQFPYKEEQHTFRAIPREHWLLGSAHGTPKMTIKKLRPARFARPAQFITMGLYSLMVLFW